ncbi:hypothetical protein LX16_1813 [Stackebrandtia albiflava]|uniref:Uncharacterized protein n=1 Tax=Stackebrandtia albiflava TaxID=406432 RepID=A0A562VE45_9ACTN|nr:hypothetical protein [Stackebrandtia albiflava]TWJ16091.1 hypothetical protein LX16_1813 [Stackebrandtia albiflava]
MTSRLRTLADAVLDRMVTGGRAQAGADCWKAPCRLRTGRCEQTCCRNGDGTVTCDNDCVC